jgi:hypothetical protein
MTTRTRGRKYLAKIAAGVVAFAAPAVSYGQAASLSAWEASDFRVWGYIPYWASLSQINSFATNGMNTHVSDVFYFGGIRTNASGNLAWAQSSYQTAFNTLRTHSQSSTGFDLHLSMFEVTGGATDATWNALIANPTARANFVSQLKTVMQGGAGTADDLKGFNFDWERPQTGQQWGDYTQLARELRTAINPLGMEVSVCDYGSTDTDWDNTASFDAKVYDQLLMMVYHINAPSSAGWANSKKTLIQQGQAKAFSDDQIGIGFGTWGDGVGSEPTISLQSIVNTIPNLPYNQTQVTGTFLDINNVSRTGTWNIESREQVRAKTQLAFDRGMPGMFSWTMHYDATGQLGLHRVIHHYTVVTRDTPDLDLDGKVNATDATTLANNMGMVLTNTGKTTAAEFDAFYLNGNWEKGDRDGNGFVNQKDADWLAGRFTALGVTLPDRLPFSGTFESLTNSKGLTGRWRAGRDGQNNLNETANFKQEANNFLSWNGTSYGAARRSNSFVTIRNQNTAELGTGLNSGARTLRADLAAPINLSQNENQYFTFLVRENTASLSPAQLASSNRTLSLQFLDSAGTDQFDVALRGLQQQISILSQADTLGQDVSTGGFSANATFLVVGKIAGNGAGANTLQASLFPNGAVVGEFTNAAFPWMLTAEGSAAYNPLITQLQFSSLADGNFTVSNVWIGTSATIPEPASLGLLAAGAMGLAARRRR